MIKKLIDWGFGQVAFVFGAASVFMFLCLAFTVSYYFLIGFGVSIALTYWGYCVEHKGKSSSGGMPPEDRDTP